MSRNRDGRALLFGVLAALLVLVPACAPTLTLQKMGTQPRYGPLDPSDFFPDGSSARPLVPGTVARGQLQDDTLLYTGKVITATSQASGQPPGTPSASSPSGPSSTPQASLGPQQGGQQGQTPPGQSGTIPPVQAGQPPSGTVGTDTDAFPFPITADVLARGQQRFNIYCSPCHGRVGDGNGMIVQRGFMHPPTFHSDRLRQAPVGHFFDVMTNGFGAMPSYAAQVSVRDRWAIAAYIRALQFSQNATVNDVPPDQMQQLQSGAPKP